MSLLPSAHNEDHQNLNDLISRIKRGFVIAEKCQSLSPPIQKFQVRLSSKDPKPAVPDWPKGRIYAIDSDEQWKDVVSKVLSRQKGTHW